MTRHWIRFLLRFKVGIAIALLIALLGFFGCTKSDLALTGMPLEWKNAADVVSPEAIQSVIEQTTSLQDNQWASVPVQAAKVKGKHSIIFLSFAKVPKLCGQFGCLGVAFLEQNLRPIWSAYWNPNLPTRIPALLQRDHQDMPSFVINQLNGQYIQQVLYAWDGRQYHPEQVFMNHSKPIQS